MGDEAEYLFGESIDLLVEENMAVHNCERRSKMSILDSQRMTKFKVVGATHPNPDGSSRQEIISHMTKNSKITLVREPSNPYDKNAIAVHSNGKQIGYLSAAYAETFAPRLDAGKKFECYVDTIGHRKTKKKETWYVTIVVK